MSEIITKVCLIMLVLFAFALFGFLLRKRKLVQTVPADAVRKGVRSRSHPRNGRNPPQLRMGIFVLLCGDIFNVWRKPRLFSIYEKTG